MPDRGGARVRSLVPFCLAAFMHFQPRNGIFGHNGVSFEDVNAINTRVCRFVQFRSDNAAREGIGAAFGDLDVDALGVMLGAILDHGGVQCNRFGADNIFSLGDLSGDLEIPSATVDDEFVRGPIAGGLAGRCVPVVKWINQTVLVDFVPFELEFVNFLVVDTFGACHVVHHGSVMSWDPIGPLEVHDISGFEFDGQGSWRCIPMADDISVTVRRWPNVAKVGSIRCPTRCYLLVISPPSPGPIIPDTAVG